MYIFIYIFFLQRMSLTVNYCMGLHEKTELSLIVIYYIDKIMWLHSESVLLGQHMDIDVYMVS